MDKYELVRRIEDFAPLDTQEPWDASGWIVETEKKNIQKIMLCLTVTQEVINQAENCDMIVSHHPLFSVPIEWKIKDIYCAHTNFDLANGGTTDTLIKELFPIYMNKITNFGFLRLIDIDISVDELVHILRKISPNLRYVNNKSIKQLKRIAFCAGSGSEFIKEAQENGADALVTGDVKFHTAIESPIILFDIGHFESEIKGLKVFEEILSSDIEIIYAREKSPFIY